METNRGDAHCDPDQGEEMEMDRTHTKDSSAIEKQALIMSWNPQGQRTRGRPRVTWRRAVEEEAREAVRTWGELGSLAQSRRYASSFPEPSKNAESRSPWGFSGYIPGA